MDALTLLTADHNRVRGLFSRFSAAEESDDTATMGRLAEEFARELDVHTTIGELFPQVSSATSGEELDSVAERLEARKAELGAPVLADKQHLTLEQLRQLASEQDIPGRSSMSHDQLAAAVSPA
jgi:hypothetical protein